VIEQLLQADRLLAVDQVDAAEAIYERVAKLDPMDAIAVVGLARVALARGDDRRAYELSARALAIDPANDMARRMEARLSEILRTRGETIERPADAVGDDGLPMRPVTTPTSPVAASPTAATARTSASTASAATASAATATSSAAPSVASPTPVSTTPEPASAPTPRRGILARILGH
jgi:hypothetical protein